MLWKASKLMILIIVVILAFSLIASAQMMGGNRGNGGMGTGSGGGMGTGSGGGMGTGNGGGMGGNGSMGSGGSMIGAAMGMSGSAVTIGNDGTLFVVSRVQPATQQTTTATAQLQTRLSALNGKKGTVLWSKIFNEDWLSRPVQGPDGHLFLVSMGDGDMGSGGMSGQTTGTQEDASLYILDAGGNLINTVVLAGEVASVPTVSGADGNYEVFVVSFDMGQGMNNMGQSQGARRDATLFSFDRNGGLNFKLSLDQ